MKNREREIRVDRKTEVGGPDPNDAGRSGRI
jgi:hypothetical protein